MTISVVIPHYEIDPSYRKVLTKCLKSMEGQYDELIIIDEKINNLSRKINKGILNTRGDFIVVCNNDIILDKGTLKDTCIDGCVVTPYVNGRSEKLFHAHMWTYSREVLAEVGLMSEEYKGFYFDDSDYWMQIESRGFQIMQMPSVNIIHDHPARTLSKLKNDADVEYNKNLFIDKWGIDSYTKIIQLQ